MVSRKLVKSLIKEYEKAWITRNPEAIASIFTKNGIYHERVLEKPFVGSNQIKKYWVDKVIGEQKNIRFKLLNFYIQDDTAIEEWEARFHNTKKNAEIHMKEVAILKIKGNKIAALREYWASETLK